MDNVTIADLVERISALEERILDLECAVYPSGYEALEKLALKHVAELKGAHVLNAFAVDRGTYSVTFLDDGGQATTQFVESRPYLLEPGTKWYNDGELRGV